MQKNKERFAAIWQAYKSKEAVVPAEVPTVEQEVEEPKQKRIKIKIIQVKTTKVETICRDYTVTEPTEVSRLLSIFIFDPVFRKYQPVHVLLFCGMAHRGRYLLSLLDTGMLEINLFINVHVPEH